MLLRYLVNYRANTARDSYGAGRSDWRINTAIFIDNVYDFSFRADSACLLHLAVVNQSLEHLFKFLEFQIHLDDSKAHDILEHFL